MLQSIRDLAIGAAVMAALSLCAPARAQTQAMLNCSGTVTGTAKAITFANGAPTAYVLLANPSASDTLWINPVGGTAAANANGSIPLAPTSGTQANIIKLPGTPTISIITSGTSTPYTCAYK